MPILTCENLTIQYGGSIALSGVTFALKSGDFLAMLGPNGSGKSTLLKGIVGLVPPQSGSVSLRVPRDEVGYLPQRLDVQRDFPASVMEVVLSGCLAERRGLLFSKKAYALSRENLALLGIEQLERTPYRSLSGGQAQRVLLARALCRAKRLLVMDEPTTGLDASASAELYHILLRRRAEGLTILMATHDHAAAHLATKILHLDTAMTYFGRAAEYFEGDGGASPCEICAARPRGNSGQLTVEN